MTKRNTGAKCYEFGRYLPETIKHECELGTKNFNQDKPWNRARFIKAVPYPDPPVPACAAARCWLRYHSPNFFGDGAIKDIFKVERNIYMFHRKRELRQYCKENKLSISSYPDPSEPKEPIFATFGPKNSLIDMIDRRIRASDMLPGRVSNITPGGTLRVYSWAVIIGLIGALLLAWPLSIKVPFQEIILVFFFLVLFNYVTKKLAMFIDLCSDIRRASHQPDLFVYEKGRLRQLLKNLQTAETELKHYFPSAVLSIYKSRPHPNKKGYSIKIVSHLMLNEFVSPLFTKPEILTFNIVIVAENIESPPILCYWFDPLKSPFMARLALPLMNFVKERMHEMEMDMNEHAKLLMLYNATDPDTKVEYQYGPFICTV